MEKIDELRSFLKNDDWKKWAELETDQKKGVAMPLVQKKYPEDSELIDLVSFKDFSVGEKPLKDIINKRRSRRKYNDEYLNKEGLSYLLWATQGIHRKINRFRTVPSAGGRHPFETYLNINRVEGIKPGLYRYLPLEHKLLLIYEDKVLIEKVTHACSEQKFIKKSAVVFLWTVIPYRTEWRYSSFSYKVIALDAGHLCQNLYLASESIGAGTCGIGAYNQKEVDQLLKVDGKEEFTIYIASVGKID